MQLGLEKGIALARLRNLLGIVEEELDKFLLSLNMIEEDEKGPMKKPGSLLKLKEIGFRRRSKLKQGGFYFQ